MEQVYLSSPVHRRLPFPLRMDSTESIASQRKLIKEEEGERNENRLSFRRKTKQLSLQQTKMIIFGTKSLLVSITILAVFVIMISGHFQRVTCLTGSAVNYSKTIIEAVDTPTSAPANDIIERRSSSLSAGSANEPSINDQVAMTELRQYFKVNVVTNKGIKRSLKHAQAMRRAISSNQDQPTEKSEKPPPIVAVGGTNPISTKPAKTISNATLKKLLNHSIVVQKIPTNSSSSLATVAAQSLPDPSNGGSQKSSNFKFVFIQRATAAPTTITSSTTAAGGKKSSTKAAPQQSPSLAASVSKQLANSLLNSAANLISNLNSSAPSLTSLASQIVSQSLTKQPDADDERLNSIASGLTSAATTKDKVKSAPEPSPAAISVAPLYKDRDQQQKKERRPTKSRPSKVYNLPVKFMANGQPSGLVFSTIRQHFATIKKLQAGARVSQLASNFSQQQGAQQKGTKRRKLSQQQQQQGLKLKGNSRLIYLPLKYLSNARPNKHLMTSKAVHRSND